MTTMFVCLNYGFSFHPPWCNLSRRGLLQRCQSHVHWHNLSVCRMLAVIITEKGVHARNEYDLLPKCEHFLQTSRIVMKFVQIDLNVQKHSRISLKQSPKTRVALWAGAHELHRHTIFRNYSHSTCVIFNPHSQCTTSLSWKAVTEPGSTNLTSWGDLLSGCQQWIPVHVTRSTKVQRGPGFWALGCKMNDSLDQS